MVYYCKFCQINHEESTSIGKLHMDYKGELIEGLNFNQFTGTIHYYNQPIAGIPDGLIYTDGIKYLAEKTGGYWLIDIVGSYQHEERFRQQPFQVWILTVDQQNHTAVVRAEDGNGNVIATQKIPYTDFPLSEIKLYLVINEDYRGVTLMLPSEY